MAKIYYYKLTTDDGGAPCVEGGLLSLAICKPMIRSTAEPGNVVFGFAANSLPHDNRLLYIARVTEKVSHGQYYTTARFANREDCIYKRKGDYFLWRRGSLHHGRDDVLHDLGKYPDYARANVLLSDDFRYFGANGTAEYKAHFPLVKEAVERLRRGHRNHEDTLLREQLEALMQDVWGRYRNKVLGERTSEPSRDVSHRGGSCGIVSGKKGAKQ